MEKVELENKLKEIKEKFEQFVAKENELTKELNNIQVEKIRMNAEYNVYNSMLNPQKINEEAEPEKVEAEVVNKEEPPK